MKTFSIITPVYNGEKFIQSCVQHVLDMNYDLNNVEHIIVDDGSTDNTASICRELASKFKHVKFYSKPNGNWGSAINYVINNKLVHNDYVVICDADDFLHKNAFTNVNKICNDCDIVVGCYKTFNDKRITARFANYFYCFKRTIKSNANLHLYYAPAIVPTCIYVRKEIFYKSKPLTENVMYQDTCLFVDCFSKAKTLRCTNKTLSFYRKEQTNNTMAQRFTERGMKSFEARFQNWVNTDSIEVMSYDLMFAKPLKKRLEQENKIYTFTRKPCFKVFPWWMRFVIWIMYRGCKKVIRVKESNNA